MTHATNPTLIERTALCSVQRTGSASEVNCGVEGKFWEVRG